jgi:hypothetical protein
MTYSLGKAATEAEEQALQAQQAATLKAPTEAEQIVRDAAAARLSVPEAPRLSPAAARASTGMSTGTKVAIGVGAAVVVAGIAYVALRPKASTPTLMVRNRRRKSSRGLRSNPPVSLATFFSVVSPGYRGTLVTDRAGLTLLEDANGDIVLEDGREYDSTNHGKVYELIQRGTPEHAAFVAEWEERERLRRNGRADSRAVLGGDPPAPVARLDRRLAVAATKWALREVFGDTIDHISDEEMDASVVLASEDRGEWAPSALAIIYVENGFPDNHTRRGMELWRQVGDKLEEDGLYFKPVNSAVFAVYPIED